MLHGLMRVAARAVLPAVALGMLSTAQVSAQTPAVPDYYPADYAKMIEASKSEGDILVYSIMAQYNWAPVLEDFKKLYPWINVSTLDLNSNEVFTRYYAERSSGAKTTDLIVSANVDGWLEFFDKGAVEPYASPEESKLPKWAKPHDGAYAVSTTPFTIVYNKLVLPEDKRPRGIQHLAKLIEENPALFKNAIGGYNVELSPFAQAVSLAYLAKTGEAGQKALETVWKQTRPEMSTGPMMAKLASGEYKVLYFGSGVVVFPKINDAVNKKVMGWNFIEDGTPFFLRLMAIPKGAPNPNSAKLLLDFILSHTGQAAFGRGGLTPYRPGVKKEEVAFYTYESIREELGEQNLSFIDYDPAMVKKIPALVERWKQVTQSK